MRALPPTAARTGLAAVILVGSALAAAAVMFATQPGTARAVPEHLSASAAPFCPAGPAGR
ncbi:hypothetical protein GCM10009530_71960 [Microbispora corallina]|uniref:Uncharacterized protein n=1 Tax=Microbispora corallina TaxID=83302 RepID=A0ABQ4G4G4_9ACTN|nr:hypothetical protein [Microbispora corallina]GIH41956.1 hypothetical protein Mco01_49560 [Microbispora corallina]